MCGLLSELFSIEADFEPDGGKQAKGLKLLLDDRPGSSLVLVAEREAEIIGMCSVQMLISTAEGNTVGLLEDLVVRSDHRGSGIGTCLLSEAVKWCAVNGISRLQLLRDADNEKARGFYLRKGWSETRLVCMRKFV
ncbi:MAG TPA: GNAT family N-acetyltransferase [Dissulfurispiraceae bacterium]